MSQFSSIDSFKTNQYLPCGVATGFNTSVTKYTAKLKWIPVNYANSYFVQVRLKGTLNWGGATTVTDSIVFNSLSPNTTYEWRIKTNCNSNASTVNSEFSIINEFTTSPEDLVQCLPPTNIVATPTTTSVTYTWDSSQFGVLYFIQMKPSSSLTWGGTSTTFTSRSFGNLSPNTSYDFRIRTTCESGKTFTNTSQFSSIGSFVTLGVAARGINSDPRIYPNPTNDFINIDMNGYFSVKIWDMIGHLVKSNDANDSVQIDMSNLSTSVYIVEIKSGDRTTITKVYKK